MATTFNKIILVGHLSREPELHYTPTGTAVTTFGVATNHRYKTGDVVHEETCFLDVVVFGRQAETVSDYLHKGSQALVEGRMRQHTWETSDGQKRSKHEVLAERVHFLGTRAPGAQATLTPGETDVEAPGEEDIPFVPSDLDEGCTPGAQGGHRKPMATPRRAQLRLGELTPIRGQGCCPPQEPRWQAREGRHADAPVAPRHTGALIISGPLGPGYHTGGCSLPRWHGRAGGWASSVPMPKERHDGDTMDVFGEDP